MIRLFLVLLLAMAMPGVAQAQVWATATSKHHANGQVIIFRFIKAFKPGFVRASQPVRIILSWDYKGPNGMPDVAARMRMDELEDALDPAVRADGFATLALVSTGNGLKEWIYYAKSEEEFFERLQKALGERARFPIEIHVGDDVTWKSYDTFRKNLVE